LPPVFAKKTKKLQESQPFQQLSVLKVSSVRARSTGAGNYAPPDAAAATAATAGS
jgi:hypothetical protein